MAAPEPSRERGEQVLSLLRWRSEGFSIRQIADHVGRNKKTIFDTTKTVMIADREHDPNDFDQGAYW